MKLSLGFFSVPLSHFAVLVLGRQGVQIEQTRRVGVLVLLRM